MGNYGIYSVGEDIVEQISQNSKTECFVGISQEGLTHEILTKTSLSSSVMTLRILVMCSTRGSLHKKSSRKLPVKTLLIFNVVLSLYTLSHTQPIQRNPTLNTRYIRLNKITIKFGTKLKPTQNSCK